MSRASRAVVLVVCLVGGLLATAAPALAANIIVDPSAADGDTSDSLCSLREAIGGTNGTPFAPDDCGSVPGDRIVLPDGVFEVNDVSLGPIVIETDVEILGTGGTDSIIDGTGLGESVFIVVAAFGPDPVVGFTDLGITGGTSALSAGGGILSLGGDLTLTRIELFGNESDAGGGLAAVLGATVAIVDSSIRLNDSGDGGGIYFVEATATISGTTISGNDALFDGGGIEVDESEVTITDGSLIDDNHAGELGGGISACGCPGTILTIEDSEVTNNTAFDGGGMAAGPVDLTIRDSTFGSNGAVGGPFTTGDGGGLLLIDEGDVTISGSTFASNFAQRDGGAISAVDDAVGSLTVDIVNSTLSGNTALGFGGGISTQEPIMLTHTTLSDNSGGSGISVDGAVVTARNSVIGHQAGGDDDCDGFLDDDGGNLDSDGSCFAGSLGGALNLGSLTGNGGPTDTHALLPGSPAIDAGIGSWCLASDQRGVTRPQGSGCDAGAYESVPAAPPPPVRYDLDVEVIGEGRVTGTPSLGIDCGSSCSASLTKGTSGRLVATPKPGHTFDGWTGDCTATDGDECTVSLDGDLSVVANFVPAGSGDIVKGRCKGMAMGTIDILQDGTVMQAGTADDDTLSGSGGPDVICGLAGNDKIKGKDQNDVLLGGAGDDKLLGGKGPDRLDGGAGTDECLGGKGKDTLIACE